MADCYTLCEKCGTPLGESAHWVHDLDCDRFVNGFCHCDGSWWCSACCPDVDCGPVAEMLRAANVERRALIEAGDGA